MGGCIVYPGTLLDVPAHNRTSRIYLGFFIFLNDEAFRYYLPAVISCSSQELNELHCVNDSGLLVDCTCQNMIDRMRDDLDVFRKFTFIQLKTILEWLLDLGGKNSGLNPYDYKDCITWLSLLIEEKENQNHVSAP